ncbi:uncharacterized protein P174DRAFT_469303 [Aspergillus novofumigatus IBT 16806]|uniref:Aminoglycoside phosphotransferase domain-containing protein n=1 Tax=Aspergillus novofumigatus (strain IBT 16806) TaxID=1392255 RepID=A0A2I1CPC0_ASPN1|nr:uncharacterized protein P174DRAFT_469303 [Aspergillus novofumigatus IBT 16806]PKX99465.1 hypothetical protein P174DRAFT_469303 [Aspergillus novofumigatus IBT 16806]
MSAAALVKGLRAAFESSLVKDHMILSESCHFLFTLLVFQVCHFDSNCHKYGVPLTVFFSDTRFIDANYELMERESQFIRMYFRPLPHYQISYFEFDVDALVSALYCATKRPVSDLASISKLAEGAFNRVLQATFHDGYEVIVRFPYRTTVPKRLAAASEAATLDLLRHNGVPVPKVLAYSADEPNPVGAEYIMLEKLEGVPLSERWFSMDNKSRAKIMKQIVEVERRVMKTPLPASGRLFYRRALAESQLIVPIPGQSDQIVLGPTVQYEWWYLRAQSI